MRGQLRAGRRGIGGLKLYGIHCLLQGPRPKGGDMGGDMGGANVKFAIDVW
jgi:hypothetical protein